MVGSGTNIAFVPDVGSSVRICLETEIYVCSFSSEFLFSFELLNLYVYSMYALFLPFCSSRSAPPFPLFPGSAPALLLAAIFRGRAQRARAPIAIVCFIRGRAQRARAPIALVCFIIIIIIIIIIFVPLSLWQPYEGNMRK